MPVHSSDTLLPHLMEPLFLLSLSFFLVFFFSPFPLVSNQPARGSYDPPKERVLVNHSETRASSTV